MALDLHRRVDRLGQRFRPLGYVLAVQDRYSATHGTTTANSISLYGFLALFALTLLAVAAVGILDHRHSDVAGTITDFLGLKGSAATTVQRAVDNARTSRRFATIAGVIGILVLGTSFANAVAAAYNIAWGVRSRGLVQRLYGLVWLVVLGTLSAVSIFATAFLTRWSTWLVPVALALALAADAGIWAFTAWWLPRRKAPWRAMLAPVAVGAVAIEVLKVIGGILVPRLVSDASQLWGTLGVVFGLLTWMVVFGRTVAYVTVIEAIEGERCGADPPPRPVIER